MLVYVVLVSALVFGLAQLAHAQSIRLNWADTNPAEDGFIVERKIGAGAYAEAGRVAKDVLVYTDTSAKTAGQPYCYHVLAYNVMGRGPVSNEACLTLPALPTAPSGLSLTITMTATAAQASSMSINPTVTVTE